MSIVRIVATLTIILLSTISSVCLAQTECTNCVPGNPQTDVIQATMTLEMGPCTVEVAYTYIKNCRFLVIDTLRPVDGCGSITLQNILGQAIHQLLTGNPMGIPDPPAGQCLQIIVAAQRCISGNESCSYCCGLYDKCRSTGQISAITIQYISGSGTNNSNNCSSPCTFTCPFY